MVEAEEVKEGKFKAHFKKHKFKYGVVIGLVVGGTVVYLFAKTRGGANVDVTNKQMVAVNSPITNNITNEYNLPNRRGHAGDIIKCVETGEVFASQRRAAEVMGVNRSELNKHINGLKEDVNGLHFEKKGDYNSDSQN